jgi:ABC-type phosphate/phosphonate transport system substrate-binding protein
MYDRPWNRAQHEALWALIRDALRDHGLAAPERLDQDHDPLAGWERPDIVLGQICNLPYRAAFRDRLTPIGTADHALPGIAPGHYRSVFVVRQDDPSDTLADCHTHRLALNDPMSQSGWGAALETAGQQGLTLNPVLRTGAHRASMAAVASGLADLAAIDIVTWLIDEEEGQATKGLRVIGETVSSPGMTFVTGPDADPEPFAAALSEAIAALPSDDAAALRVHGIVRLPPGAYDFALPEPPAFSA